MFVAWNSRCTEAFPGIVLDAVRLRAGRTVSIASSAAELPAITGAYLLLVTHSRQLPLCVPSLQCESLMPGSYVYAGSARGSGGIRARAGRHFRREKPLHWHIDHLTVSADGLWCIAVPDDDECDLAEIVRAHDAFSTAVNGFGSTDCRRCDGHLLVLREPGAINGNVSRLAHSAELAE